MRFEPDREGIGFLFIHQAVLQGVLAILMLAAPAFTDLSDSQHNSPADLSRMEQQVYRYVNRERRAHSLRELVWNEQVAAEARRHAARISKGRFFAHEDPQRGDVDERLSVSGIDWRRCAENLYEGNYADPAKEAVDAWLHSETHQRNIMDSTFSETGVGVARRMNGMIVIVQEYIAR